MLTNFRYGVINSELKEVEKQKLNVLEMKTQRPVVSWGRIIGHEKIPRKEGY